MQKGDTFEVTATGYQWWFKFEYPSEQINGAGPLTTGNELVIPANRPVHINLRSLDVMHSFWVPKLAGKVRRHRIRVVLGDRVTVAVSPYDPTRGFIVYRQR